tara:strand:+ start:2700 stop:3110 length:411 start_codon:yes stop_codon:yes gene_type:complete
MVKEKEVVKPRLINLLTTFLFVVFVAIGIAFFILRSGVTGEGFGFLEVGIAIVFGGFVTWFLLWTRLMTIRNPYLGLVIGVVGFGAFSYGFFVLYKGTYPTIFFVVTGVIVLGYLGYNFFRFREKEKIVPNEYDES